MSFVKIPVSKGLAGLIDQNGVLLLNVSPEADGTIPENQREVLLKIGDWLQKNGEAIYDTRPWHTYGEGPTMEPEGDFKNHAGFLKIKYTSKDIRYTTKGNVLYAILPGQPEEKEVLLESLAPKSGGGVLKINRSAVFNGGFLTGGDFTTTERLISPTHRTNTCFNGVNGFSASAIPIK